MRHPVADRRLRVETEGRPGTKAFAVDVFCVGCGDRAVAGSNIETAVAFAVRNREARPCCPLWRGELPGQGELWFDGRPTITVRNAAFGS